MSLRQISSFQSHSFATNAIRVSVLSTISFRFDKNAQFQSLSWLSLINSAVKTQSLRDDSADHSQSKSLCSITNSAVRANELFCEIAFQSHG